MIVQQFAEATIQSAQQNPGLFIGILTALYEIFVSLFPTKRNLAILDNLLKVIRVVLPNYKKEDSLEDAGNIVKKKISKFKIK